MKLRFRLFLISSVISISKSFVAFARWQRPFYKPASRILSSEDSPGALSPAGIPKDEVLTELRERTRLAAIAATAKRLTLKVRIKASFSVLVSGSIATFPFSGLAAPYLHFACPVRMIVMVVQYGRFLHLNNA